MSGTRLPSNVKPCKSVDQGRASPWRARWASRNAKAAMRMVWSAARSIGAEYVNDNRGAQGMPSEILPFVTRPPGGSRRAQSQARSPPTPCPMRLGNRSAVLRQVEHANKRNGMARATSAVGKVVRACHEAAEVRVAVLDEGARAASR